MIDTVRKSVLTISLNDDQVVYLQEILDVAEPDLDGETLDFLFELRDAFEVED